MQSIKESVEESIKEITQITSKISFYIIIISSVLFAACDSAKPPTLAFVGPTSGRNSDLGIDGRNGFLLAIEQFNQRGGLDDTPVEYLLNDDQHDADIAKTIYSELIQNDDIEIIIGPMTSLIGTSIIDIINKSEKITISPTVTTSQLSDKDDNFFRVLSTTTIYAKKSAEFLFMKQGIKTVSIAYDTGNAAYSKGWHDNFSARFIALGGQIVSSTPFLSSDNLMVSEITQNSIEKSPDAIVIVANSMDTSLIIQQIRGKLPEQTILTAAWAGTERLVELAGRQVEGVFIPQYVDKMSQNASYLSFKEAYVQRFNREPGFASVTSYDATVTALKAMQLKDKKESLKQT